MLTDLADHADNHFPCCMEFGARKAVHEFAVYIAAMQPNSSATESDYLGWADDFIEGAVLRLD